MMHLFFFSAHWRMRRCRSIGFPRERERRGLEYFVIGSKKKICAAAARRLKRCYAQLVDMNWLKERYSAGAAERRRLSAIAFHVRVRLVKTF
jgi:hypothetical protein